MSPRSILSFLALVASATLPSALHAEDGRYITENGVTYLETRRVEKRPVTETRTELRTETVLQTEYVTEIRETTRTVWVPVTHYVQELRPQPWWNPRPATQPAFQTRPVTRWELRTQTVREPVTFARQIPQQKIVQIPFRALGFAEREVTERIVVNTPPPGSTPGARIAERPEPPRR